MSGASPPTASTPVENPKPRRKRRLLWVAAAVILLLVFGRSTTATQLRLDYDWGYEHYLDTRQAFLWFTVSTDLHLVERIVLRDGGSPDYTIQVRTGAICSDGWRSGATGSGACSHHGGVARWLYREQLVDLPEYPEHPLGLSSCSNSEHSVIVDSLGYIPSCSSVPWDRQSYDGTWTTERLNRLAEMSPSP